MINLPSFRQLNYLVTLAETLHFTKAAERCFVSQSTFSMGIKELEDTIGGVLFERNNKQVRLTQLGAAVTSRAYNILNDAHSMLHLSQQLSQPFVGDLHIGIIPSIAPFILDKLLNGTAEKYPRLQLHLREMQSAQAIHALNAGMIDIAVLAMPYNTNDYTVTPFCEDELYLVIHEQHPLLLNHPNKKSVRVQDLPMEYLILMEEGHCLRDHALHACSKDNKNLVNKTGIEANSILTLLQLINAKIGYSLLPKIALDANLLSIFPNLTALSISPTPKRTLVLVTRKTNTKDQELQGVLNILCV